MKISYTQTNISLYKPLRKTPCLIPLHTKYPFHFIKKVRLFFFYLLVDNCFLKKKNSNNFRLKIIVFMITYLNVLVVSKLNGKMGSSKRKVLFENIA